MPPAGVLILTATAMIAFAANSVLCRLALGGGLIDAASFSSIRLATGAIMLLAIAGTQGASSFGRPDWRMLAALLAYMLCFSFAYLTLATATGALILFSAVQLTMFTVACLQGERYPPAAWVGVLSAFGGIVYLLLPGLSAPDPGGAAMMAAAGIAWGAYSLLGRNSRDAALATTRNFVCATPFALLLSALLWEQASISAAGLVYAALSGALASGLGYLAWYRVLPSLSGGHAATVQLSVPVIAAFGGWLLLSETVSLRLAIASVATLGGIALVLHSRPVRGRSGPAGSGRPAVRRKGWRDR